MMIGATWNAWPESNTSFFANSRVFMEDKQLEQVICNFSGLKLSYGNTSQFAVWLTYTENIRFATLDISANYIACQTWQGLVYLLDILAPYADVINFRNNYLPAHDISI